MAYSFSKLRGDVESDLEDRIARMTEELKSLRKAASKRGASAYEDTKDMASEVYSDLWDRFNEQLPHMKKRARVVEQAAKDNPAAAAAVGLVVVGLLVTLLARRG